MGQVVIANLKKRTQGNRRSVVLDVTLSNSYATNGDTIQASDVQLILDTLGVNSKASTDLTAIETVDAEMGSDGTSLFLDRANVKFKAFSGRAEVGAATNLSVTPGPIRVELVAKAATGN